MIYLLSPVSTKIEQKQLRHAFPRVTSATWPNLIQLAPTQYSRPQHNLTYHDTSELLGAQWGNAETRDNPTVYAVQK
jgi:hypothetical protein